MSIPAVQAEASHNQFRVVRVRNLLICLIAVIGFGFSSLTHSPSIDEMAHLPAGLCHWQFGRYEPYAVNPPLVRMLATIGLVPFEINIPTEYFSEDVPSRSEFKLGSELIAATGQSSTALYALGRLSLIPFVILGSLITAHWGSRLGNSNSRTWILLLYLLSPTVLGNGAMLTPDAVSTTFFVGASFCFYERSRTSSREGILASGLMLGLALASKFTCIVLLLLIPLLGLRPAGELRSPSHFRRLVQTLTVVAIAWYTFSAIYCFDGVGSKIGDLKLVSSALNPNSVGENNRFSGTWLGELPLPIPQSSLHGLDTQKRDFERGYRSYLMGEWKHGGWWYYYLVGFLVKEPIGFQLMLYVSILNGLYHWKRWTKHSIREWSFIVLPPLLIFGLVSSQTGFNHHMRYVLPAYPFLFIIAARTVTLGKFWKWFSYGCLTWQAVAVLWFAPHWISYFNEAAGGPENGHDWLVDSNIDWGQDILGLKWWQDEHPEVDLQAALFTGFDPADIGLKFRLPAPYLKGQPDVVSNNGLRGPQPGWYAVSVCQLKGHSFNVPVGNGGWTWSDGHFTYFMDHFEPVDMIGYSIYIYHITEQQAAEVRERLREAEAREATPQGSGLEQSA